MPPWLWGVAFGVVAIVGAIDLTLTVRRKHEPSLREAALCTLGVVALGALFGATLALVAGSRAASQFYAGWLTEYSLSLDNLFVFVLLIGRSAVPAELRSRVLLLGIGLALLLRAVFIVAGAAALNRFDWVLYVFGAILLFTAARLAFTSATEHGGGLPKPDSAGPKIFGRQLRMRSSRAPFLALVGAIAVTDVVFALDSIPAVFGLTRDPLMVLAVNAFALLGLRHLYFLIGGLLDRLVYLSAGLSAILAFIGFKLISRGAARLRGAPRRPGAGPAHQHRAIPGRHRRRADCRHGDQSAGHPGNPAQPVAISPVSWATTASRATFRVSPVTRSVSSTVLSARPRLPTVTR